MPAEPKASASLAAETGSSPVKLRYLDSVNLIERLHRRLLEVAVAWAQSIGAQRLHWEVLDWNQPAIDFYEGLGADLNRDWIPCRLAGDSLAQCTFRTPRLL